MKNLLFILLITLALTGCKKEATEVPFEKFGQAEIIPDNALTASQMLAKFDDLNPGDTVDVKFTTAVNEVCQTKGCWMMAKLDNNEEVRVTFKDYGFFVPMNAAESEAVIQGKAFLSVTSVEDLQHYAKDGGKSEEEIAAITEPEVGYGFVADGVLLR